MEIAEDEMYLIGILQTKYLYDHYCSDSHLATAIGEELIHKYIDNKSFKNLLKKIKNEAFKEGLFEISKILNGV